MGGSESFILVGLRRGKGGYFCMGSQYLIACHDFTSHGLKKKKNLKTTSPTSVTDLRTSLDILTNGKVVFSNRKTENSRLCMSSISQEKVKTDIYLQRSQKNHSKTILSKAKNQQKNVVPQH